jgi:hypothetical protein
MYSILTLCSRVQVTRELNLGFVAIAFYGKAMNGRGTKAPETSTTLHEPNLRRGLVRSQKCRFIEMMADYDSRMRCKICDVNSLASRS